MPRWPNDSETRERRREILALLAEVDRMTQSECGFTSGEIARALRTDKDRVNADLHAMLRTGEVTYRQKPNGKVTYLLWSLPVGQSQRAQLEVDA